MALLSSMFDLRKTFDVAPSHLKQIQSKQCKHMPSAILTVGHMKIPPSSLSLACKRLSMVADTWSQRKWGPYELGMGVLAALLLQILGCCDASEGPRLSKKTLRSSLHQEVQQGARPL